MQELRCRIISLNWLMPIKKYSTYVLIILLLANCQNNSLEPEFDCNLSDIDLTAETVNTECGFSTGRIVVTATGGEQPYLFSLDEELAQESPVFESLSAGQYVIMLTDKLGCSLVLTAEVANINGLSVSATTLDSECLLTDGMILISASNGVEPYTYQLGANIPQSSSEFLVGPGNHKITVIDAIGCSFEFSEVVGSNTSYSVDINPIFTSSCSIFGCHDGSNSSLPNFNNFSEVQANASMIKSRTQSGNMPRTGSLTQNQIDLIACWVDDGAKNN